MLGLSARSREWWRLSAKPDEELIAEVLGGDSGAFTELAGRHRPRVERLCRRFFSDEEMARDIAQESFIRAYTALATYRAEMPFGGWLRAIVVNLCYDELRRRRRRREDLMVMVLKESEDMSVSDIAETLGWSEAKVKIRAFRARQALRKQAERMLAAGRNRLQS